jgi:hypothetical protein
MDAIGFPYMNWNEEDVTGPNGETFPAWTARKCADADCGQWISCKGEGTKSHSDADHWFAVHA